MEQRNIQVEFDDVMNELVNKIALFAKENAILKAENNALKKMIPNNTAEAE